MRKFVPLSFFQIAFSLIFLLISFIGNAQDIKVEVQGGSNVALPSIVSINAGNSLTFKVTNISTGNCKSLQIKDISLSGATGASTFTVTPFNPKDNIKPAHCNGDHDLLFTVTRTDNNCTTDSVTITLNTNTTPALRSFTFEVMRSPKLYVSGGSPAADILNGTTMTSSVNGTYFGVVNEGASRTRRYILTNIGSCNLDLTSWTSSNGEFVVTTPTAVTSYSNVAPYGYRVIDVTFTGPTAGAGPRVSTISINNTDNGTFTFNVRALMFNFNIPGPGGVTADFRMWLKSTRGITKDASSKVTAWKDLGSSPQDATQSVTANKPTYIDAVASNINFNPVIKFENNGTSISQFLSNNDGGYYTQDIYIVMESDVVVSSSPGMTIFSGTTAPIPGYPYANAYLNDVNSVSGVGMGNFTSRISGERLWYNQGNSVADPYYTLTASTSKTYDKAGIINARNKSSIATDGMSVLFNSIDDELTATKSSGFISENLGYLDTVPDPDKLIGTPYNIGKNPNASLGNLNGRVAEIFTFATRASDTDRHKIESYLAIKYGITLGTSNIAQKDYINSFGAKVWDIAANSGYNYDVAGIGKDSISDLNQRQSKSINRTDEVTIGLGGLFTINSLNPNTFVNDGDFLVWGNNNGPYTGTTTATQTIGSGITTTLTRIDRKWKIVESKQVGTSDVGNVYVGIPTTAFSGFSKTTNEEYVLIVADNPNFTSTDIIDVVPLRINKDVFGAPVLDKEGNQVYATWYNFDDTKYFTFGKAPKTAEKHAVTIASGDYLVGEYNLNLSVDNFSIAAWIKCTPTAAIRTIMAKGEKLQMRLNATNKVEILIDDTTPKYVSNMAISDSKWHHIAFVYESGSVILYIDGILDKSVQGVVHPSPNFNHFCIGGVYISKSSILNPLLGDVDEVSVWDIALSRGQVHYIMNQEIKNESTFVSGKTAPYAASSNEIPALPWSSLRVYYDFNSFYGSTVEGLTNDRYFLRLRYLNKDKSVVRSQTTPVPYISATDGVWDDMGTWINSTDNGIPNTVGLDGSKITWNFVEIGHNITSGNRDISLLGLKQTAGTLTMEGVTDMNTGTGTGHNLTISHYLEIDGVIDLLGESQLVQTDICILDADSGGYIKKAQQGTLNGFNYNYWSSSVSAIGGNVATRGTGVASTNPSVAIKDFLHDGETPFTFTSSGYNFTVPWNGTPPGIRSIYTYWLYKFYGAADDYGAWVKIDETTPLQAGEGYTMKGPLGNAPISSLQNYVFKGLPNNGDISVPLNKEITVSNPSGDKEHLIGNPYPSALDAEEFILDNLSFADGGTNTNTIINGALYFWDHFGSVDSHYLSDYVGGYATFNLTGGAAAISNDARINNTSNAGSAALGTKIPGPYIPVNQGFFVSTKLDGNPNDVGGNIASVDGGNIIFRNSQRVYHTEDGTTSLFLKSSNTKKSSITETQKPKKEKSIIRLMYDSSLGYHRQIVLGANEKATNGFDLGYDAFMVDVNEEDMYWNFNNNKFVIQGVGNFNATQDLALGLIVKQKGIIKIKIDALENIPANIELYIKDELTGNIKNIKTEPFEINLDPGVYNNRFKLVFNQLEDSGIVVESVEEESSVAIIYNSKSEKLSLLNKDKIKIKDLALYDILGNEIKSLKLNTKSDVTLQVSAHTGLYIVKLNTEKGLINKKVIIK